MAKPGSLLRNTFNHSLSALGSLLHFLLLVVAGREMGVEDFGILTFAIAFFFLFGNLLDLGLHRLLIREIARDRAATSRFLAHSLTWKLIAAPVVLLLIILTVNLIHSSPKALHAVYLLSLSYTLRMFKDSFRAVLLAHEFFGLEAMSIIGETFALLALGALALWSGLGLVGLCWVFLVVRMVDLAVITVLVHRRVCPVTIGRDLPFLKKVLAKALPIALLSLSMSIYNYVDTVMLSAMKGHAEVGWYNAGYKFYEGLIIVPMIIGTVFMPRMAMLYRESRELIPPLLGRGIKYLLLVAVLAAVSGLAIAADLVHFVFGLEFGKAVPALNILLLGIPFYFGSVFTQMVLLMMDREKVILWFALTGLLLNVCVNLLVIPGYGYLGAAAVTVGVEFIVFILLCGYLQKVISLALWPLLLRIGALLGCSLLLLKYFETLGHFDMTIIRLLGVNGFLLAGVYILGIIGKDEIIRAAGIIRPFRLFQKKTI
jgi:O-antigen/teichoic acid export membrane protein